jgi:L-alanine-DL-glutamate epimerase-like enolase superfamily enzyme
VTDGSRSGDMTIVGVELTPFRIPLKSPVAFSTGQLLAAEHILVQVHTAGGVTGIGECIPRPMIYGETMASALYVIDRVIAPQIVGLSLLDREQIGYRLRHLAGNNVAKGSVDIAVFDALGKTLDVSCFELLGGFQRDILCTVILGFGQPEAVVDQAEAFGADYGIRSFKVKVGMDLARDIETMRALRTALGPAAIIYPDANHGFSPVEALRFLDATREYDLAWIEEPCPAEDILAKQKIASQSMIPVLGDESCPDLRSVVTEVLDGRSSMISIKLARTGIGTSQRIRDFCEATGTGVLIGSQGDSSIGTLVSAAFAGAAPVTAGKPAELGYFLELEGDVLAHPLRIENGTLRVPDAPGFGIEIDQSRLVEYRYELQAV